jgi:N-formylglutamate amidohydrolase
VPHCGTRFPEELQSDFDPKLIASPDDTDWFVEKLYDFVGSMGMTMIHANYSRWVIDLNRHPKSNPLYSDGRIITGLCPTTTFLGEPLYRDKRQKVSEEDIIQRLEKYYYPYHDQLSKLLEETKAKFGTVLLWDCHSIRHVVKTIQPNKFPDLNLGDNDESSASPTLIQEAIAGLMGNEYSFSHNHPFKGGHITRHFGKPQESQHALQLEMNKTNYMDDTETKFHPGRASKIQDVLKKTFERLIGILT